MICTRALRISLCAYHNPCRTLRRLYMRQQRAFGIVLASVTRARRVRVQQSPSFRLCRPPQFVRNVCCLFSPPTAVCCSMLFRRVSWPCQFLLKHAHSIDAHLRFASSCSGVAGPTTSLATTDGANANANATAGSSTSNWAASACHLSLLSTISGSATWARHGSEVVCKNMGS